MAYSKPREIGRALVVETLRRGSLKKHSLSVGKILLADERRISWKTDAYGQP